MKRAGKYLYVRYLINETWNTASIYSIICVLSYFFFFFFSKDIRILQIRCDINWNFVDWKV